MVASRLFCERVSVGTIVFSLCVFVMNHNGRAWCGSLAVEGRLVSQFIRLIRQAKESDLAALHREELNANLLFMKNFKTVLAIPLF